ncbi:MAG: ATP-binding cassette domain-containing protein [Saprospiraceae bacterium]|nr:ATP-binding cassette domain-containing protein [Saprospiraceae bacterium]
MPIQVKHLSKKYGQQTAVDDLSFSAKEGEVIGFLGPNGAGKTTTFKLLMGFIQPSSGEIDVNGESVTEDPLVARKAIGYLPESNPLYKEMYVLEFLNFISETHRLGLSKDDLIIACKRVGLDAEINKKIKYLSKGYKQRVGLAQAILHDPPILILDEPTTGLDANQLMEIRALIRDLGKEKLILFSSHIMQEIESVCDRVIILDQGSKIADNSLEDITSDTESDLKVIMILNQPTKHIEAYQEIKGILKVKTTDQRNYYFDVAKGTDPRADLFRAAVKNDDVIIHLSKEGQTFEQTFQKLTNKP